MEIRTNISVYDLDLLSESEIKSIETSAKHYAQSQTFAVSFTKEHDGFLRLKCKPLSDNLDESEILERAWDSFGFIRDKYKIGISVERSFRRKFATLSVVCNPLEDGVGEIIYTQYPQAAFKFVKNEILHVKQFHENAPEDKIKTVVKKVQEWLNTNYKNYL